MTSTSITRTWRIVIASSFLERAKGLLGTSRDWGDERSVLLIPNCASVHTFGMSYSIDVAFIGKNGQVLRSERDVKPGRVLSRIGSACVLERPYQPNEAWLEPNDCMFLNATPLLPEHGESREAE